MKRFSQAPSVFIFLLLSAVLMLCIPMTASAAIVIELSHVGQSPDELPIGKSLDVGFVGGDKETPYTVLLMDDVNKLVSMIEVTSDVTGRVAPTRTWSSSGVKGCNVCPLYDPASYLFESFAEAKTALDQRIFEVQVYRGQSPEALTLEATRSFKTIIDDDDLVVFPSNGAGCKMTLFEEHSDMYLSMRHTAAYTQAYRVWVVPAQTSWQAGDPLVDVRSSATIPQIIFVPPGPNPTLTLIWAGVLITNPPWSDYHIIVRRGLIGGGATYNPSLDLISGPPRVLPAGIMFEDCAVCPPPHDPVD